jgi:tRNA dimethylallyltransferase
MQNFQNDNLNIEIMDVIQRSLSEKRNLLCVIAGATAVGKTEFTIQLAKHYGLSIISSDSRQFYREMSIGTAKPDMDEQAQVPHYFIDCLSVQDYYSVSRFEQDVLGLLPRLFAETPVVIMTGGSGLYIDAVCKGIDDLPDPDIEIRDKVMNLYRTEGIEALRRSLRMLDPEFIAQTDIANPKRLVRALEVSLQTGKAYSEFLQSTRKERAFEIVKFCVTRPREELFQRINMRVERMMQQGLLEEAKKLLPYREYNALNTVGYKQLFDYFDGKCSLEKAVEQIKTDTRRYAKRQLTWYKRDGCYIEIPKERVEMLTQILLPIQK